MNKRINLAVLFIAIAMLLIFTSILPLTQSLSWFVGPDILLVLTLAWLMRSPEGLPIWVLGGIFLLADFFLMRAPGLMTAAVILVGEFLRSRDDLTTEVPFAAEWAVAAGMIGSIYFGTTTILVIFGAPSPDLGPLLILVLLSIGTYPLVVFCLRYLVGMGRRKRQDSFGFGGAS